MRRLEKILWIIPLLCACTGIKYGAPENTPTCMELNFSYDWNVTEPPADMYVVMSRIINTIHYAWRSEDSGTTFENISRDNTTGTVVTNGEYYLISFNTSDEYEITGLEEFIADDAASMKGIRISCIEATAEEIASTLGENSPDFNPLFPYIRHAGPLYIDVRHVNVAYDMNTSVVMTPQSLSQELTFEVGIELEDGITIREIVGEISGVGSGVEAMSGYIDGENTCRAMFRMEESSVSGNIHTYTATIHALGLIPSTDANFITGPGILHLSITTEEPETKIFHAGINIRETIINAGLTEEADDGMYRISTSSALLRIQNRLIIRLDQIKPGDGQGIEIWFDSDENHVDVEL